MDEQMLYFNKFVEVNERLKKVDEYIISKGLKIDNLDIRFSFASIQPIITLFKSKIKNINRYNLSPLLLLISYVFYDKIEKFKDADIELKNLVNEFCNNPNILQLIYDKSSSIKNELKRDLFLYYFYIYNSFENYEKSF